MTLPGSAWVKIEPSAVEVDRRLEVLHVSEAAGHALDLLNLAVESLAHRLDKNGRQLAEALLEFTQYREAVGRAQGAVPNRELRVIGHSYGGLAAELMLGELAKGGHIQDGEGGLFSRVLYFNIDAGWRGFDAPWLFVAPGIKQIGRQLLPRIPLPKRATRSALSIMNRTSSMDAVINLKLPQSVTTHLVTVIKPPDDPLIHMVEPVNSWYSYELRPGELERLWRYFRGDQSDSNQLDNWAMGGAVRQQGLQQLLRTLERDGDYPTYAPRIKEAALHAPTAEEFAPHYDALVANIVDTFHGQHTRVMWEDPKFLPWLRFALAQW